MKDLRFGLKISDNRLFLLWIIVMHCWQHLVTCRVTSLSSTITSFVRKSAPIVALYWLLNFLLTYWFINDVFPTLEEKKRRGERGRENWKRGNENLPKICNVQLSYVLRPRLQNINIICQLFRIQIKLM